MSTPAPAEPAGKFSATQWLVVTVAAIGFLFDTYELLMFPVIARDALADLLRAGGTTDPREISEQVLRWNGRMLWLAALCGGVFGLLGGYLIDRFGRRSVMAGSILVYSFSPVLAALSTSLPMFVLFRCTTFIGVCVEFVAAITWLAELFQDRRTREFAIGWTQAFASVGGLVVSAVFKGINQVAADLPPLPTLEGTEAHAAWRYTLLTGLVPGLLIAVLLPFVPESRVWRERRAAGTLRRPSFGELFAPGLIRTTLVTAALSGCAYAAAFGALQLTPPQIVPGLPSVRAERTARQDRAAEAEKAAKAAPGDAERAKEAEAAKKAVAAFPAYLRDRTANAQLVQELGGLTGRVLLAILLVVVASRRVLIRLFQGPGVILFPLVYLYVFQDASDLFMPLYFLCGLVTVAQFSFFGEYLPKVFPVHLRGTGGSFATNVGGRMIGTMAAPVVTEFIAPMIAGGRDKVTPAVVATAAGVMGTGVFLIGFVLSFLLPEPKEDGA